MAPSKAVEFGLLLETEEGMMTRTDSIWRTWLSGLGRNDANNAIENYGITNAWFPFSKPTLRQLLGSCSDEITFSEWQHDLIHSSKWPEVDPSERVHLALEDGDEFMTSGHQFGHGAFGHVEEVTIPTSSKDIVCVRKKIHRPRKLDSQRAFFAAYSCDINVMRQISHHHCVELVGSYADQDSVGILLLPIADMDLAAFLNTAPLSKTQSQFLRRSIGCVCSALNYLHKHQIRYASPFLWFLAPWDMANMALLFRRTKSRCYHMHVADFGW
jgi:serine/threonine protein kinase